MRVRVVFEKRAAREVDGAREPGARHIFAGKGRGQERGADYQIRRPAYQIAILFRSRARAFFRVRSLPHAHVHAVLRVRAPPYRIVRSSSFLPRGALHISGPVGEAAENWQLKPVLTSTRRPCVLN